VECDNCDSKSIVVLAVGKLRFPMEAIEKVNDFMRDFKNNHTERLSGPRRAVKKIKTSRFLPNDEQIILTCKHSNIETLATFDEDFKRIPWLRIIP